MLDCMQSNSADRRKGYGNMENKRDKIIIRTGFIGILVNIVLVIFKSIIGLITNSIAIILDAVNNLSDVLSSVITIIGTKLSGKEPDKKHPYGHGRIEYLTSVVISVIVLLAGVASVRESVVKIIAPEETNYNAVSLVIISVAIFVKIFLGRYVKGIGKKINAQTLVAAGTDALFDAVLALGTLAAAIISIVWNVGLEGIIGAVISLFIIKAGISMLLETLNSIIGTRYDAELTNSIKERINSYDDVHGTYDLALHNYGPTKIFGTAHIEVDDTMTAKKIHNLTRRITEDIMSEFGIIMTIGIYASNTSGKYAHIKQLIEEAVAKYSSIMQMHGFYIDEEHKLITFDIITDFDCNREEIRFSLMEELSKKIPDYTIYIVLDTDISE